MKLQLSDQSWKRRHNNVEFDAPARNRLDMGVISDFFWAGIQNKWNHRSIAGEEDKAKLRPWSNTKWYMRCVKKPRMQTPSGGRWETTRTSPSPWNWMKARSISNLSTAMPRGNNAPIWDSNERWWFDSHAALEQAFRGPVAEATAKISATVKRSPWATISFKTSRTTSCQEMPKSAPAGLCIPCCRSGQLGLLQLCDFIVNACSHPVCLVWLFGVLPGLYCCHIFRWGGPIQCTHLHVLVSSVGTVFSGRLIWSMLPFKLERLCRSL